MIVRETPSSFTCIGQHDHAHISGVMADHWLGVYFGDASRRDDVTLAVYEHDRAWIPLDAEPLWNEQTQAPYSFLDFPPAPRLHHYEQGITELENLSPYAGLLSSLHYTGFPEMAKLAAGREFLQKEAGRQQRLRRQLGINASGQPTLDFHVQLLKFLDRLSLYLCMNEPGADKEHEHPWYKGGIPFSDYFDFTDHQLIQTKWASKTQVQVAPFPFDEAFCVTLPYKELRKNELSDVGLAECFQRAPIQKMQVWITE
ncbi:DUF3891 family protein [Hymenobacter sp. BT188]|uniref:DUF3891 family protein n=1 Tax=Hymenobacter sp. BT188 TaxID=2763504 RepID=UPI0016519CD0|nr:DUF3891 family protein [Hymenobacter sp. BT188]MBC6606893.1 DUF3891 family protein [Hymenobacter sp. BT188]